MSALPLSESQESRAETVMPQLPYAPLPMPRQQLESGMALRHVLGRVMRLPIFATRRGY